MRSPKTSGGSSRIARSNATANATVRVKVELLGHLQELTGVKELEIDLSVPTIAGLVKCLSRTYGEEFNRSVAGSGSLEFRVLILVNGMDIDFIQKSVTPLSNGDKVVMIPLVAGG